MSFPQQIAKQIREVYFGGNWTTSNLKEHLNNITWQQATSKVYSFNTIAALVFHINYYICAVTKVLEGELLNASDKISFDHPPINNQDDWELFLKKTWIDAENFAKLVEKIPETKLWEIFTDEKYGSYYRNLHGIIEHTHYHLGQIVLLKKMILVNANN